MVTCYAVRQDDCTKMLNMQAFPLANSLVHKGESVRSSFLIIKHEGFFREERVCCPVGEMDTVMDCFCHKICLHR